MTSSFVSFFVFLTTLIPNFVYAKELKIGETAPAFSLKKHDGQDFKMEDRKKSWTVLYFYPKSETPGCTKQACAFRDNIDKIRNLQAEVFGISINSVEDQKNFKSNHQLNFDLLADTDGKITELYGAKMPLLKMAKRWTFIVDPDLKIRAINKDVDPVKDAEQVATKLKELQNVKK